MSAKRLEKGCVIIIGWCGKVIVMRQYWLAGFGEA
jgi:hypothetical protein